MHHRDVHPTDMPGCFGCKALGIGYQGLLSRVGPDPTRRTPVTIEEGPHRGRVGGHHTEHWDGRQDATVTPGAIRVRATTTEER
jgi:hypothetical protein